MSKPIHIESKEQLASLLSSSRVVVADFYADWCGPCKAIAPFYEKLCAQLSRPNQITFIKVNTDTQPDISRQYNVTALPTFMIFKAGREAQRIKGADPKPLDAAVKTLAAEASSSDAAGSSSDNGAGRGGGQWKGADLPRGYTDVTASVDQRGLDFLNLSSDAGAASVVFDNAQPSSSAATTTMGKGREREEDEGGAKDYIESDTDEQLMLFIPFQSTLKVHSLHLTSFAPATGEDVMRPRTVKIYPNRSHVLGFDEAESLEATQTFELDGDSYDAATGTTKLELRYVKFQNVTSLVVFVVDGDGDGERTRVDRIRIVGEAGEKRAMGKLEKIGDEPGE